MVFSTAAFLYAFLPAFLLCYVLLPWKNAVALLFSLLFFSWGEGVYLILLLAVIGVNYIVGGLVSGVDNANRRRVFLGVGVALNLSTLAYYKYAAFIVADVLGLAVSESALPQLPLGISFFIFQSMSYLIDVYRREAPAARSVFDLALYIALFPQLIAGPIVRYGSIAEALRHRHVSFDQAFRGIQLFVLGLSYKVLVANNTAEIADAVFAIAPEQLAFGTAWLGMVAYTLQIFFDFAGYSLMAIGLGRIMGFQFPQNFNYPYVSRSITEFWRRWHMSLSNWFRDYLYIPLGGNRAGAWCTYRNLLLVFLLCGLWHGAAWTFVAWGLFHGFFLVLERGGLGAMLERLPRPIAHLYVLLLVMIAWVLFRAETFSYAGGFIQALFVAADGIEIVTVAEVLSRENAMFMCIGIVFCLPLLESTRWRTWDNNTSVVRSTSQYLMDAMITLLLLSICSVYVMSSTYNPFIYFRF